MNTPDLIMDTRLHTNSNSETRMKPKANGVTNILSVRYTSLFIENFFGTCQTFNHKLNFLNKFKREQFGPRCVQPS